MKLLMAANWKMYKTGAEGASMLKELGERMGALPVDREVAVFAPFTALAACAATCPATVRLGGQNCYPGEEGAFTGEISPHMLQAEGCSWVLTGHSERRSVFHETDAYVGEKTSFALRAGLDVILCIGESLEERDGGMLREVLERQLKTGLADVPESFAPEHIAVAYEPVWAIGTGRVAGSAEIIEAHGIIRTFLKSLYTEKGSEIRILYGGSVKPDNCPEIIRLDNVNGVLVGGASLQAESFAQIVLS